MANEISVSSGMTVKKGSLQFNGLPSSFRATLSVSKGPTPGAVTVTTGGVTISMAELTTPGIMQIVNTDATNYVSYGLYISSTFYPLGEIKPGECYVLRLARDILTANTAAAVLRFKANTGSCLCMVNILND